MGGRHLRRWVTLPYSLLVPSRRPLPLPPLPLSPTLAGLRPARAAAGPAVTSQATPFVINTGDVRAALSHSGSSHRCRVSFFPPSLLLLILSRSSALWRGGTQSSPHPALAFLVHPHCYSISPSAAAATAAQLVSVPRFSPNVVPAAYGPGRLGYFCSR